MPQAARDLAIYPLKEYCMNIYDIHGVDPGEAFTQTFAIHRKDVGSSLLQLHPRGLQEIIKQTQRGMASHRLLWPMDTNAEKNERMSIEDQRGSRALATVMEGSAAYTAGRGICVRAQMIWCKKTFATWVKLQIWLQITFLAKRKHLQPNLRPSSSCKCLFAPDHLRPGASGLASGARCSGKFEVN